MAALTTTLLAIAAASLAAGTGYSMVSGERAAAAQEKAQEQATLMTMDQNKKAEENINRANQKKPNASAILSAAQQAAKQGASGTMLTGPQGVTNDQLSLGKNSLLGS